ncbi:MAG: hypothetical protein WC047_05055 [Kiritimatiellales bacterium]
MTTDQKEAIRLFRNYSKASIIEYMALTLTGYPCSINYNLLRLIELKNKIKEINRMRAQYDKILEFLRSKKAVEEQGGKWLFTLPHGRELKLTKLISAWHHLVAIDRRIKGIESVSKALQLLCKNQKGGAHQLNSARE